MNRPTLNGPWTSFQRWKNLAFLHWKIDANAIRPLIPSALELDTFEGSAYIGIVPFTMESVRPRFLPAVPRYSSFPELNVRTYVKYNGISGVYFLSLDATRRLFVWGGRRFYKLPYYFASMTVGVQQGRVDYELIRGTSEVAFKARYWPTSDIFHSTPGSIEEFLTERYCLFAGAGANIGRCDIHHERWPLQRAEVEIERNTMLSPYGLSVTGAPLAHFASSIDVRIWPLKFAHRF
jgi:uncharacterized protein YqjF (DUF2071 family)